MKKQINVLLVEKYRKNNYPIIAAVSEEDPVKMKEKITKALMDYYECDIQNLKYDFSLQVQPWEASFVMINDKEKVEMEFEILNLPLY
jgi:hypothetical protein